MISARLSAALATAVLLGTAVQGCKALRAECRDEACWALPGVGSAAGGGGGGGGGAAASCTPGAAPADGGCIDDEHGIFVRASGSDENGGSRDAPVRTLSHAVVLAQAAEKAIFVCAETFLENVEVPAGIRLFGALACEDDWSRDPSKRTVLTTQMGGGTPLTIIGGDGEAVVEDFEVVATDALEPSGSSIAVVAFETQVRLSRCLVRAGAGADGAPGDSASSSPAPAGPPGNPGVAGGCYTAPQTVLGAPAKNNPSCTTSVGGKGGNAGFNNGTPGSGSNGSPSPGAGTGASGEPSTGPWSCSSQNGTVGPDGPPGLGATADGWITPTGYVGQPGGDGEPGSHGRGGGGGGGRRSLGCPTTHNYGASGGSGGPGGCGGEPGQGGQPGGSSVGILSIDAEVVLDETEVRASKGGTGGDGGDGQPGGDGGPGGAAGDTSLTCGRGGSGGAGGYGGAGGGGRGGHSVAVLYSGAAPVTDSATLATGDNGLGGVAGAGAPGSSNGAPGLAQGLLMLPRQ